MKKLIDCFTFYNELELLELRFLELYDVVDKFVIVEANKTFKGDNKPFILEENKWRFTKWWDKVAHIKIIIPDNLTDVWSREKYQRNSSTTFLNSMQLSINDIVVITDVDEIPNIDVLKYIKESFDLQGIYKLEMDTYFGSLYNKQKSVKWYHPKIMNWGSLKMSNPEDCRLNFNCQWWEKGGWHFSYFGGPSRIANKINNFSHQEYNLPKFKNEDYIRQKIKNGEDLFGEWRNFENIDPAKNTFLPKNWNLLLINEDNYRKIQKENSESNILNIKEYSPNIDGIEVRTNNISSAWGDIPKILPSIIKKFNIKGDKALEFGVEYGYSTSAISNFFKEVIGVDTFEGDIHSTLKENHMDKTKDLLNDFQNIKIIRSDYRDFTKNNKEIYDLIHIDIIHDYENTYSCGEWSVNHSPVVIFHDTMSFPEVMRACKDLSIKYKLEFYNYPNSNGLGILYNRDFKYNTEFTISWISNNEGDFNKYLSPSIQRIKSRFNTNTIYNNNNSSYSYNKLIEKCETRWIILCHEDVSFSGDLLDCIKETIDLNPDFYFLGFVGSNKNGTIKCNTKKSEDVITCDSCFIVIDLEKCIHKFDESTFDDFHLHIEDMCMQLGGKGKTILCNYLEPEEYESLDENINKKWIYHGSTTYLKLGPSWGKYEEYKNRLNKKWNANIPTT